MANRPPDYLQADAIASPVLFPIGLGLLGETFPGWELGKEKARHLVSKMPGVSSGNVLLSHNL